MCACLAVLAAACATRPKADVLVRGAEVFDGSGTPSARQDVAVTGDRITFVGDAAAAGLEAHTTVDAAGFALAPGFIDMHSHAELNEPWGRDAMPFLFQGITTVVVGADGAGEPDVAGQLERWRREGIGTNALTYVGHGTIRRAVLGMEDRAPTDEEMARMKALVRQGMVGGAFGLSTGLFYTPGVYATTDEVIALSQEAVAAAGEVGAIYDTHDRDLGASYQGIGFDASVAEGIRIGEVSGARVIFSHFNPQGRHNYGRAEVGAQLIEAARARGVDVQAAQHPYTATQSNLAAYALPNWAAAGGREAMLRRFDDAATVRRLDVETEEMLAIRGGADKIRLVDPRPAFNGKTLGELARAWRMSVPAAVRRILREGNAAVMNLDLYDMENTRVLAQMSWMMTCTDGRTPEPDQVITHPRPFGAFTKKLRELALDEGVVPVSFAIRSMTGLAADFLRLPDRGYVREGMRADLVVLDLSRVRDRATYESPRQLAEGTVHVLVNGRFAIRDGAWAGVLAGEPIARRGSRTPPTGSRLPVSR